MNVGKYFWILSSLVHLPLILEDSASFMTETPFYTKLRFLVKIFKETASVTLHKK